MELVPICSVFLVGDGDRIYHMFLGTHKRRVYIPIKNSDRFCFQQHPLVYHAANNSVKKLSSDTMPGNTGGILAWGTLWELPIYVRFSIIPKKDYTVQTFLVANENIASVKTTPTSVWHTYCTTRVRVMLMPIGTNCHIFAGSWHRHIREDMAPRCWQTTQEKEDTSCQ